VEKKTQLYFRDDNKFEFRKMPLKYSCFLEKKGEAIKRAWRHSYAGQYAFSGYKTISADTVTLVLANVSGGSDINIGSTTFYVQVWKRN